VRLSHIKARHHFNPGKYISFSDRFFVDANRYQALCFWLSAEPKVLNPRLDARVDEMVQVSELHPHGSDNSSDHPKSKV
jgi:hypothetical protein